MFLEGCRWNYATCALDESEPKVLFSAAPAMWLRPVRSADVRVFPSFSCPWYRTADRRGVLATTGHSSNFIARIALPIDKAQDPQHWIRRGVCREFLAIAHTPAPVTLAIMTLTTPLLLPFYSPHEPRQLTQIMFLSSSLYIKK
jgi:hypothetical protein